MNGAVILRLLPSPVVSVFSTLPPEMSLTLILNLVPKESAVIVGRCADYVLREHSKKLRVFIHTNIKARAERVAKRNGISESEAFDRISKTDRRRANYYNFYTGKKWGEITNYDLALDSSVLGVEGTAKIIAEVAKALG